MTPAIKMAESEYMIPVNFMKEVALELYKKGDVSLEKGAEIAKLPLLDFIDLIEKEKIFRKIDVDNIRKLT